MNSRMKLLLLAATEGLSNAEAAERVHLSKHTVDRYMNEAIAQLGGRNRAHAISIAYRTGLFPVDDGALRARIAGELHELADKIKGDEW